MDFVAIDFETANSSRSSPCSAALVRFRGGVPVESWTRLMRPPQGHDDFHGVNVSVHGITADMVGAEPRFGDLWSEIEDFIGDDMLVAHNAAFDVSVLRHACEASEIECPEVSYMCTLQLAKSSLDLLSYGLVGVASALGVPMGRHHQADADALAAGEVMLALARRHDVFALEDLSTVLGVPAEQLSRKQARATTTRRASTTTRRARKRREDNSLDLVFEFNLTGASPAPVRERQRDLPIAPALAHPDHRLFGEFVAFTGGLETMSRSDAFALVEAYGGTPQASVTKKTGILVVGPSLYDGNVLDEAHMTGKMAHVARLRQLGQDIEIMSEEDFRNSI